MLSSRLSKKTIVLIIAILITSAIGFSIYSANNRSEWKVYTNKSYRILLRYPEEWKPNPEYSIRYDGNDGFFSIGALSGKDLTIDEVTFLDAYHEFKPYGSNPKIIKMTIQGQEARLILPSPDQSKALNHQSGLIVKYPVPAKIEGTTYYYFILWADESHIKEIAETLKFIHSKEPLQIYEGKMG